MFNGWDGSRGRLHVEKKNSIMIRLEIRLWWLSLYKNSVRSIEKQNENFQYLFELNWEAFYCLVSFVKIQSIRAIDVGDRDDALKKSKFNVIRDSTIFFFFSKWYFSIFSLPSNRFVRVFIGPVLFVCSIR